MGFEEALVNAAMQTGGLPTILLILLVVVFRKQIGKFLQNGSNSELKRQIDLLENNHIQHLSQDITDFKDEVTKEFINTNREIAAVSERLARVETVVKMNNR